LWTTCSVWIRIRFVLNCKWRTLGVKQGCLVAYFQNKNPNLGNFRWDLQWKMWSFGIFCGHLIYSKAIWKILWLFGIFFPFWYVVPKKSGNPGCENCRFTASCWLCWKWVTSKLAKAQIEGLLRRSEIWEANIGFEISMVSLFVHTYPRRKRSFPLRKHSESLSYVCSDLW
jgi:hypothetical protein